MLRIDNNRTNIKSAEILAFSCVRNEILRLPYFLNYHRELGVDRFFFIDNGSTDGTKDYLLSQNDCHIYYTEASYAGSKCGVDWLNKLLSCFGNNHWTLTLDTDELLIYPKCEVVSLHKLTTYLDIVEAHGLITFMLDMYSDSPIKDTHYTRDASFLTSCEYFDSDTYHERDDNNIPVRGGPRHRLFWQGQNREKPSPVLKKIPLVKWRDDLHYLASTHVIDNIRTSSLTGAILHFKLFSDFFTLASTECERKEHWDNAAQYESYWNVLRKNESLSAIYDGSVKYIDSMQLVKLGLLELPDSYMDFTNGLFDMA